METIRMAAGQRRQIVLEHEEGYDFSWVATSNKNSHVEITLLPSRPNISGFSLQKPKPVKTEIWITALQAGTEQIGFDLTDRKSGGTGPVASKIFEIIID